MNKFRVGDKVIIKNNKEIGTILDICKALSGTSYLYKLDIEKSIWRFEENLELYEPKFTLDILKSGMEVRLRNGICKVILRDSLLELDTRLAWSIVYKEFAKLSDYTKDDLFHKENDSWDIMKIYDENGKLLWNREEIINWSDVKFGTDIMVWQGDELPIKARFLRYDKGKDYPFVVWSYGINDIDYYVNGKLMESDV